MKIEIATDGSCIQSGSYRVGSEEARPGAWAFIAKLENGVVHKAAMSYPDVTNGAMEVRALMEALGYVLASHNDKDNVITIKCDSQYTVSGYNEWLSGWHAKGYHKKGGLKNKDFWMAIHNIKEKLEATVIVEWIRAHNGHPLNEAADELANTTARKQGWEWELGDNYPKHITEKFLSSEELPQDETCPSNNNLVELLDKLCSEMEIQEIATHTEINAWAKIMRSKITESK